MKQYEASRKFLELIEKYPDNFTATYVESRSDVVYSIKNKFRGVSINIRKNNAHNLTVVGASDDSNCIMFVENDVLEKLHDIACEYIAAARIQAQVDSDNVAIYELIKFYDSK